MKRALGVIFFLLLAAQAAAQQPQPTPADLEKAKTFFDIAQKFYQLEDFSQALENYQQSYNLSGKPLLLFNIAQCQRRLDRKKDALASYQKFVKTAPADTDPNLLAQAESFIQELEVALAPPPPKSKPVDQPPKTGRSVQQFLIPIALAGAGTAFGVSAFGLHRSFTNQDQELDPGEQRIGLLVAGSSDLLFVAAGVTAFLAFKKSQPSKTAQTSCPESLTNRCLSPQVALSPQSASLAVSF